MGFGTVFTMLAFLLVFAGMIVAVINVQQTMAESQRAAAQQQDMLIAASQERITITQTNYTGPQTIPWTKRYADEYATGTHNNTQTSGDSIRLQSDQLSGTYTSTAYDTGFESDYATISWEATTPENTEATFQIRTASTQQALQTAQFLGPDGTTTTRYNISGASINQTHNTDRYVQWRAHLDTTTLGSTPTIQSVSIGVRRNSGHASIEIENTGERRLRFEETDVYMQGVRIQRSDAQRTIQNDITGQERLWDPRQRINLTVFTDIAFAETKHFVVTNRHARDEVSITA
jgi:archaellum component FlaF (FlaF/FlaG flagellin family)